MKLALYRKYRSATLGEVMGQDHIAEPLANAIKSNRIQHAYLFTGSHGIGKTSVARIFAHEINDFTYDGTTKLDIIEIDGASNRKIDEIRDLREKIHILPSEGKYKVYIIDEVHMLTKEAFNALLKTLEEPPPHAVFILATTEPHKLPATIISRTQRYNFKKASIDDLVALIEKIATKEKIDIEQDAKVAIAKQSNSSFRDALSILDQAANHGENITAEHIDDMLGLVSSEYLQNLSDAVKENDINKIRTTLDEIYVIGTTPKSLSAQFADFLLDTSPGSSKLIKELLRLRTYEDQEVGLLITLLSHTSQTGNVTKSVQSKVEQEVTTDEEVHVAPPIKKAIRPAPEEKEEEETPKKQKSPELESTLQKEEPESVSETVDDTWKSLLQKAKADKLKLYPILRLSKPVYDDGKVISIQVRFPLHKKKLEEQQCKKELGDLLSDVTGDTNTLSIEVLAAETSTKSEETVVVQSSKITSEQSKKYDSIKEIMGGGETVEL